MAQSTPPNWGRQWSPHHQDGDYVVMDPRVVQYEQPATPSAASLPRSMMAPPYMMSQPYSQGTMTSIPTSQYQSQPSSMTYSTYTSSPTSLISHFHEQLRFTSSDSEHSPVTSHQESPRSGSVPSSRTLSTTSDNRSVRQAKPTSISVPGISKTVAPIITGGHKIRAHTVVDALMKNIQALPETDDIVSKVEEGIKQEFEHRQLGEELRCVKPSEVKVEASPPPSRQRDLSKQDRKKEKKFWCDHPECPAGFAQRPHLTIHKRTHNKEKPFACQYCSMTFTQTGNRKSHESTHTKVKPYPCALGCGKWFRQRSTAKQHLRTHTNVREFVCKLCETEKRFALRGNLKTHLVAFHKEEVLKFSSRVASISKVNDLPEDERDIFIYFATIFKNLNKGIKGRGKNKDKVQDFGQSAMTTPPATNSSCSSSSASPIAMHTPMHAPHFHESQQQHHIQLPVINTHGQYHHSQQQQQQHSPVHHHDAHGIPQQQHHTGHGLPSVYSMGLPPPMVTTMGMAPSTTMAYDIHSTVSTSGGAASGGELAFGERLYH